MASSSKHGSSPVGSVSNNSGSEDSDMGDFEGNVFMSGEKLEKSLTNLNINIALIVAQREEMARTMKEFVATFTKQDEIMGEETKQLRIEMSKLRKNTNRSG